MNQLSIYLLGPFQVKRADEVVSSFQSDKVRALLAYLAVESTQPHPRETLAGLLWPDYPERSARTNLRNALANLRQVISDHQASPPFLHSTRQTIQFNQASQHWLDVAQWADLLPPYKASKSNIAQLEQAVNLYQTPFLTGFSLPDCPEFEAWMLLRRETFALQLAETLQHLTRHYEAQGAYQPALGYARRWLALDNCQEVAHRQVMRLLAQCGRRSEALQQFETCRRLLVQELGIEPAQETTRLCEQIRTEEGSNQPTFAAPKHNLPQQLTPLIGREVTLAELTHLLADPELRLITVVGPGGVGKTRLTLETVLLAAQTKQFSDGVYLVSLAPLQTTTSLVTTIAEAIGFSFYDQSPPAQQLGDYLAKKQMLLLLDNFEHLLDGVDTILDLLQVAPKLKILLTSRIPLQVQGEQLYPLTGLTYPDQIDTANKQTYGAISLFTHNARRLRPDFVLSEENRTGVIRICQLVKGMPLALILAAAWIELLTPAEIAAEIECSFAFLQAEWQNLPPRQRSLQAVFNHSWQLLSSREQETLAQLAIFRGGVQGEAAQAVTGARLIDLLSLVTKRLLTRNPAGRYELHELLRQFAQQKLEQNQVVATAAYGHHSAYYTHFLQQREAALHQHTQQHAIVELEQERANIKAAWGWATEHRQLEHLEQAITGLGRFYEWQGWYQDGDKACQMAITALKGLETAAAKFLLVKLWYWQALFKRQLGQNEAAIEAINCSLQLLTHPMLAKQDTRLEQAAIYVEMGEQYHATNWDQAKNYFEQALVLYRTLNDFWGIAQTNCTLASTLLSHQKDQDRGKELLTEGLQLFQTLGDQRGQARTLNSLGFMIALQGGQLEEGISSLRQSLFIHQNMHNVMERYHSQQTLGYILLFAGEYAEAQQLGEETLRFAQEVGNQHLIIRAQDFLAKPLVYQGNYKQAWQLSHENMAYYRSIDNLVKASLELWSLGDIALGKEQYFEAEQFLQESVSLHQKVGIQARLDGVLTSLGLATSNLGKLHQARHCLKDALKNALKIQFWFSILQAMPAVAFLALKEEKPVLAIELYAVALQYKHVANSRWYEDIVGRHIAAAAAQLSPEVVTAAQQRGRERDLWRTAQESLDILRENS